MAEKPPKIGKSFGGLGGPLLGGAHKVIKKAAEGPTKAGAEAVRDMGERTQGRAASRANRRRGILASILGGQTLPTQHQTVERIKRGQAWDKRRDSEAASILMAEARRGGTVGERKARWVEAVGDGRERAEQAVVLLLNNGSMPEVQNSYIPRGRNRGKRISETGAWQDIISRPADDGGENALWKLVAGQRPDLTPDILQGAERDLSTALGQEIDYDRIPGDRRDLLDELSNLGLTTAISRLEAGSLSGLHEGFFREVERLADPVLAQALYDRLHYIKHNLADVGRNAIGSLGGPRATAIDDALAVIGQSYNSL